MKFFGRNKGYDEAQEDMDYVEIEDEAAYGEYEAEESGEYAEEYETEEYYAQDGVEVEYETEEYYAEGPVRWWRWPRSAFRGYPGRPFLPYRDRNTALTLPGFPCF